MRQVLMSIGVLLIFCSMSAVGEDVRRPVVGAIRWDAWTGGPITRQVERTLGPQKYHARLPWFAEVIGENHVRIDGGRQTVMDREIELAANSGLDYWAFLAYPESSPMSEALKQYLRSSKRRRINFCLILHNALLVSDEQWPKELERLIALLKQPEYQTVLDGRPLVYAFSGKRFPFARFSEFLTAAESTGLSPYSVFMGWNPPDDFKSVAGRGFDAVSAYAKSGSQTEFRELSRSVEQSYWRAAAEAQVPYVPLVTTGWDKRPRQDNPVSWEGDHDYHKQRVFPSTATPEEIAAHLSRAVKFLKEHPTICISQTVIIYAWNEYDEGGWIAPTTGRDGAPDTRRLDAIRSVLRIGPGLVGP